MALHGIMPESVVLHDHWTINEKNMIIIVPMFSQELCYDNYQTPFSHVAASKGELVIYIEMDTKQNDLHGVMVQHA